jgi:hypothetical protein
MVVEDALVAGAAVDPASPRVGVLAPSGHSTAATSPSPPPPAPSGASPDAGRRPEPPDRSWPPAPRSWRAGREAARWARPPRLACPVRPPRHPRPAPARGRLELARALAPPGGVLGQRGQHHRVQRRVDLGVACRRRLGWLVQVPGGDRHRRAVGPRPERRGAGHQLVQHTSQAVQVRAGIHRPTLGLLGRQISGRAQHRPIPGQGHRRRRLDDAEVGHLHPPLSTNQHVGRLDVAVHQPLSVRGRQRCAHLHPKLGSPPGRQPALVGQQLGQALAGHILHHQIVLSGIRAAVEHGHDVGMAEAGRAAGLTPEPLHEHRVLGIGRAEHLDRHLPLQHPVAGQVHPGHPAHPQQRAQPVAAVKDPSLQVHHAQTLPGSRRPSPTARTLGQHQQRAPEVWTGDPVRSPAQGSGGS